MSDYTEIKAVIDEKINTNGRQSITGAVLNDVLNDIVDNVKEQTDEKLAELTELVAGNTGVSDYPTFSASTAYAAGDVVIYSGKLYRFTTAHAAGAWNGNDVETTSINEEAQRGIADVQSHWGVSLQLTEGGLTGAGLPSGGSLSTRVHSQIVDIVGDVRVELNDGYALYYYIFTSTGSTAIAINESVNTSLSLSGYNGYRIRFVFRKVDNSALAVTDNILASLDGVSDTDNPAFTYKDIRELRGTVNAVSQETLSLGDSVSAILQDIETIEEKQNSIEDNTESFSNDIYSDLLKFTGEGKIEFPAMSSGTKYLRIYQLSKGNAYTVKVTISSASSSVIYWDIRGNRDNALLPYSAFISAGETESSAFVTVSEEYDSFELYVYSGASIPALTFEIEAENSVIGSLEKQADLAKILDTSLTWGSQLNTNLRVGDVSQQKLLVSCAFKEKLETLTLYFAKGTASEDILSSARVYADGLTDVVAPEGTTYLWFFNGNGTNVEETSEVLVVRSDSVTADLLRKNNNLQKQIDEAASALNDVQTLKNREISVRYASSEIAVKKINGQGGYTEVILAPFGVNSMWQIRGVALYDKDRSELLSETTSTDSVGPYQVQAVNNADGENIGSAVAKFTGGTHGYNGDTTGSSTALSSVAILTDGDVSENFSCGYIDVVVTNLIQGWNTRKEDGSGRAIIKEEVHYIFDEREGCRIENYITALEDVIVDLYYGMQIAFANDYVRFMSGEKSAWIAKADNASYVGDYLDSVEGKSGTMIQRMWVEKKGLGHFLYVEDSLPKAFQSGKIYYNLVRQSSLSLAANEEVYYIAGYDFRAL